MLGSSYQAGEDLHGAALAAVVLVVTRVLHQPLQVRLEHLQEPVPVVPEQALRGRRAHSQVTLHRFKIPRVNLRSYRTVTEVMEQSLGKLQSRYFRKTNTVDEHQSTMSMASTSILDNSKRNDEVVLNSTVTPCYCSMLGVFGRDCKL